MFPRIALIAAEWHYPSENLMNCRDARLAVLTVRYLFMSENEISYHIRGAIFEVYNRLGAGLLESVYEASLAFELISKGMSVRTQVALPVITRKSN